MRLTDVMLAFPDLITGLLVLAVLGPVSEDDLRHRPHHRAAVRRIAYGPTLAIKGKEFVEAAARSA